MEGAKQVSYRMQVTMHNLGSFDLTELESRFC